MVGVAGLLPADRTPICEPPWIRKGSPFRTGPGARVRGLVVAEDCYLPRPQAYFRSGGLGSPLVGPPF
jgi:hypothetical protein